MASPKSARKRSNPTKKALTKLGKRSRKAKFLVAISGGHTRSVAFAFQPEVGSLGEAPYRGINPHLMPVEMLAGELLELLDRLALAMRLPREEFYERVSHVILSCPGAASSADQTLLKVALSEVFTGRVRPEFMIVDDTWAGLAAGALSLRGTCAIAGTGASVFVGRGRKPTGWNGKIDGWGYVIGDFGSGFQLTVEMFREFCRYWNELNEAPKLFAHVDRTIQELLNQRLVTLQRIRRIESCQKWFDSLTLINFRKDWKVEFSLLAAAATQQADVLPRDPMAERLVSNCADQMIRSIEIALGRWPVMSNYPLVLQGGMFEHSAFYRHRVVERVRARMGAPVAMARYRPVLGAALILLDRLGLPMDGIGMRFLESCLRIMSKESAKLLIRTEDSGFAHSSIRV